MSLRKQIETDIREHRIENAFLGIRRLLRIERYSLNSRLDASEFYRRISRHRDALRVLPLEVSMAEFNKQSPLELKTQLQLARILNLLGASEFALRIISRVPDSIRRENTQATVGIFISNYKHEEAYPYLRTLEEARLESLDYTRRLQVVSLCDCLAGMGRRNEAIEKLNHLIEASQEHTLLGIAHQALAAQWILSGQPRKAAPYLEAARKYFGGDQTTFDSGFVCKWEAAMHILLGNHSKARELTNKAMSILFQRGYKPEAWLEVLYFDGLSEFLQTKRFPENWMRILAYPSHGKRFIDQIEARARLPEKAYLSLGHAGGKPSKIFFDYYSDTFGNKSSKKGSAYRLGLSLSEQTLYFLAIAGKFGIPQYRLYECLWKDELFSYGTLKNRFDQLLHRLRESSFSVRTKDLHLQLMSKTPGALWRRDPVVRGWPFLENAPRFFKRSDVESFFALSPRHALSLCQQWIHAGAVRRSKNSINKGGYEVYNT